MRKAIIVALMALALCGCDNTTAVEQKDENAGRFQCEGGYVYVITDTKTGVQYLGWQRGYGGGICVLVDSDGKPMLAEGEDA